MKKTLTQTIAFFVVIILLSSCASPLIIGKPLPPGQQKKVEGKQSAKEFAPGQQKKSTAQKSAPASKGKKKN